MGLLAFTLVAAMLALAWWTWRPVVRRRVIVQTEGAAFDGVLVSRRGPLLVLADATARTATATRPLDGEVVVERTQVQWIQVVGR